MTDRRIDTVEIDRAKFFTTPFPSSVERKFEPRVKTMRKSGPRLEIIRAWGGLTVVLSSVEISSPGPKGRKRRELGRR